MQTFIVIKLQYINEFHLKLIRVYSSAPSLYMYFAYIRTKVHSQKYVYTTRTVRVYVLGTQQADMLARNRVFRGALSAYSRVNEFSTSPLFLSLLFGALHRIMYMYMYITGTLTTA